MNTTQTNLARQTQFQTISDSLLSAIRFEQSQHANPQVLLTFFVSSSVMLLLGFGLTRNYPIDVYALALMLLANISITVLIYRKRHASTKVLANLGLLGFLLLATFYLVRLGYGLLFGYVYLYPSDLVIYFMPWMVFVLAWAFLLFGRHSGLAVSIALYITFVGLAYSHVLFSASAEQRLQVLGDEQWLNTFATVVLFGLLLFYTFYRFLSNSDQKPFDLSDYPQQDVPLSATVLEMQQFAHLDKLTGLYNRAAFLNKLQKALEKCSQDESLAIILIDLDQLKPINDQLGHSIGDEVLRQVADRLQQVIGDMGFAGRLGGDEYALVAERLANAQQAVTVARAIHQAFQLPFEIKAQDSNIAEDSNEFYSLIVTGSIGISLAPEHGRDQETLMGKADKAVYYVKQHEKNNFQLYSPDLDTDMSRYEQQKRLQRAFDRKHIQFLFQPIMGLQDDKVHRFELKLHCQDKQLEKASSDDIIALAEEIGLMLPLGEAMLREAIERCKEWQSDSHAKGIGVSVNVSAQQLARADFAATIDAMLREAKLAPKHLAIEITESSIMQKRALQQLEQLHKHYGVNIVFDHFESSFPKIKELAFDYIKVNRSAIYDAYQTVYTENFIPATVQIAKSLNVQVIAEGVENLQQYETIKQWGFDEVQGVFIGNAIQPDDIPALVKRNTSIFSNKHHTAAHTKLTHLTRVGFATLHESMLDLDSLTMDVLDVER